MAFEQGGIFIFTYCGTGPRFIRSHPKDRHPRNGTEGTSEGLEGKLMLQNVVRNVYWRVILFVRRIKRNYRFPQKLKSRFVPVAMLMHSSKLGQSSAFYMYISLRGPWGPRRIVISEVNRMHWGKFQLAHARLSASKQYIWWSYI
jgi:hypothetical protein